ncbi:MAG: hypothetical protein HY291_08070 [Planctomycetes bacterium]|nr:hypothetical protein [Planctomycetota bacterium]
MIGFLVFFIVSGVFTAFYFHFYYQKKYDRELQCVERWACKNGYRIIEGQRRIYLCGPFGLLGSRYSTIFHIIAENREGRRLSGWARVGFLGDWMPDNVTVVWDSEKRGLFWTRTLVELFVITLLLICVVFLHYAHVL